jgi:hypothetical protein
MAVKYVKDFSFDKSFGYTGSTATPKGAQTNADAKRIPAIMKAMPGKGAQTNADVKRMPPAMPAKAPVMRDDSEPTAEELKLMRQAREYKREDKATSDAAKEQMGFKNGGMATAIHKHERALHKGEPLTKLKKGGGVMEKATGERYPSKSAMMKHEKTETPRMQREEMVQKRVVRGPAMAAGRDPRIPMLMCGGKVKK